VGQRSALLLLELPEHFRKVPHGPFDLGSDRHARRQRVPERIEVVRQASEAEPAHERRERGRASLQVAHLTAHQRCLPPQERMPAVGQRSRLSQNLALLLPRHPGDVRSTARGRSPDEERRAATGADPDDDEREKSRGES
jgi:hypothetical protein